MGWPVSLLAATLAALVGTVLAGVVANAYTAWFGMSSREGASGYFVVVVAAAGGLASFALGLAVARAVVAHHGSGFLPEAGAALAVVLAFAALAALVGRLLGDVAPTIDGRDLEIELEVRVPPGDAGASPAASGAWRVELASLVAGTLRDARTGTVEHAAARREDGRWIVPARVSLFTERGERALRIVDGDGVAHGFVVPLPARPGPAFEAWSDWLPRSQASGAAWPDDAVSYRFRVRRVAPPPPPPTEAERQAERAAREEAEFAALAPDAPLTAWLAWTAYPRPQTERALRAIAARPELASEMRQLATGDDARAAFAALHGLAQLPEPAPELVEVVAAAAHVVLERIERFNATPAGADPHFEGAVDPAIRFSAWIDAARALRERRGASFVPELTRILEASRVRPESTCMRGDVCRVASHYLHAWAGVAPLATDPPARPSA